MPPLLSLLDWSNVSAGGGIPLALTGISIVFSGLLLIAGFISLLPRSLRWWDRRRHPASVPPPSAAADAKDKLTPEVRAALAWVALRELEVFQLGDTQRLTLRPSGQPGLRQALSRLRNLAPPE